MRQMAANQFLVSRRATGRSGFTLLEVVLASGLAAMLAVGLMSCLLIAGRALDERQVAPARQLQNAWPLEPIVADLRHAISFSERTAHAATFQVPDRDGDETPETIRYSWSGTPGAPLLVQYNGGSPATLAADVNQFDLAYGLRPTTGTGFAKGLIRTLVEFETFTEIKAPGQVSSVQISAPPGLVSGNLLVAALAVSNANADITAPAGWTVIHKDRLYNNTGALGVFWRTAGTSEPPTYNFSWGSTNRGTCYAWIMRFRGHNPAAPVHAFSTFTGSSQSPTSPSVTTSIDYTTILRIGAFAQASITVDVPGLPGHQPITMDQATVNGITGGAGYLVQELAGASGPSQFSLMAPAAYRTVTVALAPEE